MTTSPTKSLRAPIGRARGLGSSHYGTEHWWHQCLSSVAIIVLAVLFIPGFLTHVIYGDYHTAVAWLHNAPIASGILVLLLIAGCHHAAAGLQIILEDYVGIEPVMLTAVVFVKFLMFALAVVGTLSVVRVYLGM
ncbi:MAG: succinate dehydrogenase, hydrophobic membrane anchor protein [Bdellovibrionales bacterium]